jgi:hypothetical protein
MYNRITVISHGKAYLGGAAPLRRLISARAGLGRALAPRSRRAGGARAPPGACPAPDSRGSGDGAGPM